MISLRRFFLTGVSALALAATLFLSPGCKPKPHPEAFTAKLTEFEGVQAVYTLRHPKLIFGDLDKLMTEVPETAMARMFFGQLTAYGYPEFSEIEAGSNLGVAMLELNPAELGSARPEFVGFAKIKEGGKIWTALSQSGLTLEKHGAWTWIAKDAATFAKVKAPDTLTAYIERPQTEELRTWGRVSPALLARAKELLIPKIQAKLTERPADEQKALLAYFDVVWSYLAQLHSIGGSLDLNDQGITLAYSAQFLPDSATGTWLRYAPGPAPKIAQSVPADGLVNIVLRQNMDGQIAFVSGLLDALIAIDYPSVSTALKTAKDNYLAAAVQSDGGAVMTMNMSLPKLGETPAIDILSINSGTFTQAQATAYYKASLELSKKFTHAMMSAVSKLTPGTPMPKVDQQWTENALTIDGIPFGSIVTTTTVAGKGQPSVIYYGVVGGNLVYAMNEAALRAKLPALVAKEPVAGAVQATFKDDEFALLTMPGAKIVDMVTGSLALDLADSDVQAQIKTFKDNYTAAGPIKTTLTASQAQVAVTTTIPYKFISQSVRLFEFASAHKAPTTTP